MIFIESWTVSCLEIIIDMWLQLIAESNLKHGISMVLTKNFAVLTDRNIKQ